MTELSHHIFGHRVCFFIYKAAIFTQERSQEEGKECGFIYVYEQNIINNSYNNNSYNHHHRHQLFIII